MLIHDVYPSSNVDPTVIAEYGWQRVEDIPAVVNNVGRLAPQPERSAFHSQLRATLEANGTTPYSAQDGTVIEITDFALAHSPINPAEQASTAQTLGFFVLQ